jgi:hypothetical protein
MFRLTSKRTTNRQWIQWGIVLRYILCSFSTNCFEMSSFIPKDIHKIRDEHKIIGYEVNVCNCDQLG